MRIKDLFGDEDAVSPVIGVILMVAITVILAAVIASFVLGLGDQNNPAPTASFDFSADIGNESVTVTHSDGDEINSDYLFIRGQQLSSSGDSWTDWNGGTTIDVAAGNSIVVDLTSTNTEQYEIRVVWEDPDSDSTSTLDTDQGPDA